MYIPNHYNEENWDQQERLIKTYPLGTIISNSEDGKIIANHIPFYLYIDETTGDKYLHAHIAKKNHQVPSLTANDEILIIFQSHDSYISPSYYPTKQETHKFVPTWDFASIHIYGKSKIINDTEFVRTQLENFTNQNESKRAEPWKLTDAPENYVNLMMKSITGLEIKINSIECKYKFEQKMPRREIDGVINGLAEDNIHEVSQFVKEVNN